MHKYRTTVSNQIPTKALTKKIIALTGKGREAELLDECYKLHPADLAVVLYRLSSRNQHKLLGLLKGVLNPEVLVWLDAKLINIVLEQNGVKDFSALLEQLDIAKLIRVMSRISSDAVENITHYFQDSTNSDIKQKLKYPHKTLGRIMSNSYVTAPQNWTVLNAQNFLRLHPRPQMLGPLIILDDTEYPRGILTAAQLANYQPDAQLDSFAQPIHLLNDRMSIEEAILAFKKYDIDQCGIINSANKVVGCISTNQILRSLEEETREDALQLHGISIEEADEPKAGLGSDIIHNLQSRSPWILINLLIAFGVSSVVVSFESVISEHIYAASLMSVVASSAGSAGAQTVAVTVRMIAKTQLPFFSVNKIIFWEIITALINGLLISGVSFALSMYMYNDFKISGLFALALLCNFILAGAIGAIVPVVLDKFRLDPAAGSNVITTACTDTFGFFIFLYMVHTLYHSSLIM